MKSKTHIDIAIVTLACLKFSYVSASSDHDIVVIMIFFGKDRVIESRVLSQSDFISMEISVHSQFLEADAL